MNLDLNQKGSVNLTISSVEGFAGPVDLLIPGFDVEAGEIAIDPPSPITVPADGSVQVVVEFATSIDSLAGTQELTIGAAPQDTAVAPQSVELTYTVNNLLEIPLMDGAGGDGGAHDFLLAASPGTLSLRPGTGVIWTNYDTQSSHVIHGANGIAHGPGDCNADDASMQAAIVAGQRGESYGQDDTVGYYYDPDTAVVTGEVIPMILTGGGFWCHCHQGSGAEMSIEIDESLTPQPDVQ